MSRDVFRRKLFVNECINEWTINELDARMDEWKMDGCIDGWMGEWMSDGWIEGW